MTVTAITSQQKRPYRSSVFVDGAFAFGMDNEDLACYRITEGMEITKERLDKLLSEVVYVKARDTALRYLGSRPRSYCETVKRLESDGYPEKVILRVMRLMRKYRYIDDAQFARDYAVSRLNTGRYGIYRVKQELKTKGIDEELINEALEEAAEVNDEVGNVRKWLIKKGYDVNDMDLSAKKRLVAALMRRGFPYSSIKEAMTNVE